MPWVSSEDFNHCTFIKRQNWKTDRNINNKRLSTKDPLTVSRVYRGFVKKYPEAKTFKLYSYLEVVPNVWDWVPLNEHLFALRPEVLKSIPGYRFNDVWFCITSFHDATKAPKQDNNNSNKETTNSNKKTTNSNKETTNSNKKTTNSNNDTTNTNTKSKTIDPLPYRPPKHENQFHDDMIFQIARILPSFECTEKTCMELFESLCKSKYRYSIVNYQVPDRIEKQQQWMKHWVDEIHTLIHHQLTSISVLQCNQLFNSACNLHPVVKIDRQLTVQQRAIVNRVDCCYAMLHLFIAHNEAFVWLLYVNVFIENHAKLQQVEHDADSVWSTYFEGVSRQCGVNLGSIAPVINSIANYRGLTNVNASKSNSDCCPRARGNRPGWSDHYPDIPQFPSLNTVYWQSREFAQEYPQSTIIEIPPPVGAVKLASNKSMTMSNSVLLQPPVLPEWCHYSKFNVYNIRRRRYMKRNGIPTSSLLPQLCYQFVKTQNANRFLTNHLLIMNQSRNFIDYRNNNSDTRQRIAATMSKQEEIAVESAFREYIRLTGTQQTQPYLHLQHCQFFQSMWTRPVLQQSLIASLPPMPPVPVNASNISDAATIPPQKKRRC